MYEYRTLHIEPRSWPRVIDSVETAVRPAVERDGGTVFGLFSGLIGFASDEGVLVTAWPDAATLARSSATSSVPAVLESSARRVDATVRPSTPAPPTDPGVYAHRWFRVRPESWDEFVELSRTSWVPFEELFATRIVGLWRAADSDPSVVDALLMTWYRTLADWERSRIVRPDAPSGVDAERYAAARSGFGRRAQLTEWSIVRITRLAGQAT